MAQMNVERLNEAFQNFASASKSLESYYQQLQERIVHLTGELEVRNRQLNDALADAERNKDYLKAVLYNLEEAIIAVDPEGRVTTMNRSAEELLQTSLGEAIGMPFTSLPFTMNEDANGIWLEAGSRRYSVILSQSDVVDAEGCLRGRVILIKDITRMRELEQLHERNQRLIAMGEMAARLVHEIRNPLCSIELFSSMIERELTAPEHRGLAQGITAGIGNINSILTNMLLFARPNKPTLSPMRLDEVLRDSVGLLQAMFDSRRVRLSLDAPPCEMAGDPELLKQVFLNLLINAVQAMPDGGFIDARIEREGGRAAVIIRDTGAGIAPEHIEKIFDPFFTTKDEGTGLGLAIVNTIMQANNGFVNVSSEPGEGSTFRLSFPLNEEPICHRDAGREGTVELVDTEHSEQLPEPDAKYGLAYYSF
ncbi:MAG TPA: ATP-binding protein [Nitrospirota bacterium]|nr:ATP-binding protein [Nitrospirota bacterium]